MDFDQAITTHISWKKKLSDYLKNPDGSLKPQDIAPDNKCVLGQWLYGEGVKWKSHPPYDELKRHHAEFHRAASDVVLRAHDGANVSEELLLGANSSFSQASSRVVAAIMALKKAVG